MSPIEEGERVLALPRRLEKMLTKLVA